MSDGLATIHLHGPLADRFGTPHRLAVRTPTEAVAALDANYPGFLPAFAEYECYGLFADGDWRGGDAAASLPFSRELHFCPIIEGRAPVGALLIGAIFPALSVTATTIIGGLLVAGLMIGLSFLLAPKIPKKEAAGEEAGRDENFAFTGPENVVGQGAAVPLIYGRVHCGSVVISAGLEIGTDIAPSPTPPPPAVPPSSAGGGPPIVGDPPHPQGWHRVTTTNVSSGSSMATKYTSTWQNPDNKHQKWTHNTGFYTSSRTSVSPEDNDWREGSER